MLKYFNLNNNTPPPPPSCKHATLGDLKTKKLNLQLPIVKPYKKNSHYNLNTSRYITLILIYQIIYKYSWKQINKSMSNNNMGYDMEYKLEDLSSLKLT